MMKFKPADWPRPVDPALRRHPVEVMKLVVANTDKATRERIVTGGYNKHTRMAKSVAAYLLAKWCGLSREQITAHFRSARSAVVSDWLLKLKRDHPDGLAGTRWESVEAMLESNGKAVEA